jgi:hypothetical protein
MRGREFAAPDDVAVAGRHLSSDLLGATTRSVKESDFKIRCLFGYRSVPLERGWLTPWQPAIAEKQFLRRVGATR